MRSIREVFKEQNNKIFLKRIWTLVKYYLYGLLIFALVFGALNVVFPDSQSNIFITIASVFTWFCCANLWYVEARKMGHNDKIRFHFENQFFSTKGLALAGASVIGILLLAGVLFILFQISGEISTFLTGGTFEGLLEEKEWSNKILIWFVKFCFAGFYWIAKPLGNTFFSYAAAFLTLPVVFIVGYTVGIRVSIRDKLKKELEQQGKH